MHTMFHRCLGLLLLLLLCRCGMPGQDCTPRAIAQVPLTVANDLMIVPVAINGVPTRLILDTGAERTVVSQALVDRLHLSADARYMTRSNGVGGSSVSRDVLVNRFVLGGVNFPLPRLVVGSFNAPLLERLQADGLLGADLLLAFDLDIDPASRTLTLYRSRSCPVTSPPWTEAALRLDGTPRKDRLALPFLLDGTAGVAVLDTGAQRNVLMAGMARRLNLTEAELADDPRVLHLGAGPHDATARLHRFRLLQVGAIAQADPAISILPMDTGTTDAVLGQEFLHGRRVWLSFRNREVFVSRLPGDH